MGACLRAPQKDTPGLKGGLWADPGNKCPRSLGTDLREKCPRSVRNWPTAGSLPRSLQPAPLLLWAGTGRLLLRSLQPTPLSFWARTGGSLLRSLRLTPLSVRAQIRDGGGGRLPRYVCAEGPQWGSPPSLLVAVALRWRPPRRPLVVHHP